ncbi:MAG: hypothetical protein ABSB01_20610, partial [Streptosporangiaceae bacterium]
MDHGTTMGWEVIPALQPTVGAAQDDGPEQLGSGAHFGRPATGTVAVDAAAPADAAPAVPGAGVRGWGVRGGRLWAWAGWPLVVVLVVQAALSVRL